MSNFRSTMEDCNLYDLGFLGNPYTWSNKHECSSFTKERLDHVVANQNQRRVFNEAKVEALSFEPQITSLYQLYVDSCLLVP